MTMPYDLEQIKPCFNDFKISYSLAKTGDLDVLKAHANSDDLNLYAAAYGAVAAMRLQVVDWLLEAFSDSVHWALMEAAIDHGDIELLKDFHEKKGCQFHLSFYYDAVREKRFDMVRYAYATGHRMGWDDGLFLIIACEGDVETLKTLFELGCPHDFSLILGFDDLAPEIEEWIKSEYMKKT